MHLVDDDLGLLFPTNLTFPNQVDLILEDGVGLGKARVLRHGERLDAGGEQAVSDAKHAVDFVDLGIGPGRLVAIRLEFTFEHHQHASFARGVELEQFPRFFGMGGLAVDHVLITGVAGPLAAFSADRQEHRIHLELIADRGEEAGQGANRAGMGRIRPSGEETTSRVVDIVRDARGDFTL